MLVPVDNDVTVKANIRSVPSNADEQAIIAMIELMIIENQDAVFLELQQNYDLGLSSEIKTITNQQSLCVVGDRIVITLVTTSVATLLRPE